MSCTSRAAALARRVVSVTGAVADVADVLAATPPGAARRQRGSLRHVAHRPWPCPEGRWIMGQTWADLLFCHWPVPADALREHVPSALPLDLFDGTGWVSVAPFEVTGTRPRGAPPPPVLSRFLELNVRTYVTLGGRPGIWFFSLDATSPLAVAAARRLYRLPYFRARMTSAGDGPWVHYRSERCDPRGGPARFEARYRPTGGVRHAAPGSLDEWLVERYRLYTVDDGGRLFAGDIHHAPWTLQDAEAEIRADTMTAPPGVERGGAPLLHFARRQDAVFWPLSAVSPRRGAGRPRRS